MAQLVPCVVKLVETAHAFTHWSGKSCKMHNLLLFNLLQSMTSTYSKWSITDHDNHFEQLGKLKAHLDLIACKSNGVILL